MKFRLTPVLTATLRRGPFLGVKCQVKISDPFSTHVTIFGVFAELICRSLLWQKILQYRAQAHDTLKETRVKTDIASQLVVVIIIRGSRHDEQ